MKKKKKGYKHCEGRARTEDDAGDGPRHDVDKDKQADQAEGRPRKCGKRARGTALLKQLPPLRPVNDDAGERHDGIFPAAVLWGFRQLNQCNRGVCRKQGNKVGIKVGYVWRFLKLSLERLPALLAERRETCSLAPLQYHGKVTTPYRATRCSALHCQLR